MPTSKRKSDPTMETDLADRALNADDLKRMRRTPQVTVLRRALELTQEQFSERYGIPLGTLRDWEQGRSVPDQPARAYLRVIAGEPVATARVLSTKPASSEDSMTDKRMYVERRPQGDYAVRRANSERASDVLPTQAKAIGRARELSPGTTPHVERVRHTTSGSPDKWRKP